jgi:hypothetical protein
MAFAVGERRRCAACRGWFRPDARVGARQKTCSKECRGKRRRHQGRRRREADVAAHREAERIRQRAWRKERRRKRDPAAAEATMDGTARQPAETPRTASPPGGRGTTAKRPSRAARTELTSVETEPPLRALEVAAEAVSRAETARVSRAETARVSRAERRPQVLAGIEEIVNFWDNEARLSRAEMMREMAQLLGEKGLFVGQVGQE